MSDEIRMMPTLKPVNLNSDFISKGMKDLLGANTASQLRTETDLFGISGNLPREYNYEILLNEVNLRWNESTSSFRSSGKIGIGFIGSQPMNIYVDGFIETRRRSGISLYLSGDNQLGIIFIFQGCHV
jgi:hypothetical protein